MFTKEDNQVLDRILNARKTCRAFAENVPTDDEIKEVIQAGCIAPLHPLMQKQLHRSAIFL